MGAAPFASIPVGPQPSSPLAPLRFLGHPEEVNAVYAPPAEPSAPGHLLLEGTFQAVVARDALEACELPWGRRAGGRVAAEGAAGGRRGWGGPPLRGGVRGQPDSPSSLAPVLPLLRSATRPELVGTWGLTRSPPRRGSAGSWLVLLRGGSRLPGRGQCSEGARPGHGCRGGRAQTGTGRSGFSHRGLLLPDGAAEPGPQRGVPFLVP